MSEVVDKSPVITKEKVPNTANGPSDARYLHCSDEKRDVVVDFTSTRFAEGDFGAPFAVINSRTEGNNVVLNPAEFSNENSTFSKEGGGWKLTLTWKESGGNWIYYTYLVVDTQDFQSASITTPILNYKVWLPNMPCHFLAQRP